MNLSGKTLNIEGKDIYCPPFPIYYIKSFGYVVDIETKSADAHSSFTSCTATYKELWKLTGKGIKLVRRVRNGREG
jgi:hypothetical protein